MWPASFCNILKNLKPPIPTYASITIGGSLSRLKSGNYFLGQSDPLSNSECGLPPFAIYWKIWSHPFPLKQALQLHFWNLSINKSLFHVYKQVYLTLLWWRKISTSHHNFHFLPAPVLPCYHFHHHTITLIQTCVIIIWIVKIQIIVLLKIMYMNLWFCWQYASK